MTRFIMILAAAALPLALAACGTDGAPRRPAAPVTAPKTPVGIAVSGDVSAGLRADL